MIFQYGSEPVLINLKLTGVETILKRQFQFRKYQEYALIRGSDLHLFYFKLAEAPLHLGVGKVRKKA